MTGQTGILPPVFILPNKHGFIAFSKEALILQTCCNLPIRPAPPLPPSHASSASGG